MIKKRFLLAGLMAAALLVVFSAFTMRDKKATADPSYYFYPVTNGVADTTDRLNDEPLTIEQFENPLGCDDESGTDCVRAWQPGHTPTPAGAADHTIYKME